MKDDRTIIEKDLGLVFNFILHPQIFTLFSLWIGAMILVAYIIGDVTYNGGNWLFAIGLFLTVVTASIYILFNE